MASAGLTEENHENLSLDSWSLDKDLKLEPPECEAALTT
jgi:hypothetical protein